MKKNLTELVFILDRSGSMGGLEQDTTVYTTGGSSFALHLDANEIKWYEI